jgi:hypothetical protein
MIELIIGFFIGVVVALVGFFIGVVVALVGVNFYHTIKYYLD